MIRQILLSAILCPVSFTPLIRLSQQSFNVVRGRVHFSLQGEIYITGDKCENPHLSAAAAFLSLI